MLARIIGFVNVSRFITPAELEAALALEYHDNYSAFVFGSWGNCVLWNGSGDSRDCELRVYDGEGRETEHLRHLPGVRSLVEHCFRTERLKWLRLFRQDGGVLLPHVDFIGMGDGFLRLHVSLLTHPGALHSEEGEVYHMHAGEVWLLEASRLHSAGNLSGATRLSLCADFEAGVAPESLVSEAARASGAGRRPEIVGRPPFTPEDKRLLNGLTDELRQGRTREVLARLIRVHLERQVASSAVFEWLDQLAAATGDAQVVSQAREVRRLALGA
jgi:hypothetical protein